MNNLLVSLLHEANDLKSKTSTHEHSSKGDPQKISDRLQQQHNKPWKMDETNEDPETDLFFPSVDRFLIKWNCWGLWTLRTQCSFHTRKSSKEDDVWTGNISPVSHRISSCWRFSSSTRQHLVASELSNLLRFLLIIDRTFFFSNVAVARVRLASSKRSCFKMCRISVIWAMLSLWMKKSFRVCLETLKNTFSWTVRQLF